MRILFVSWPGYGHLLPMVPLIRAAQRGGHDVVVSSGRDLTELITRLGVPGHASGATAAECYARLPQGVRISDLPASEQPTFAGRHLFGAGGVDRARDVLDLIDEWHPELVVHDTLELGSVSAAMMRGVPHVTHGYGPPVPDQRGFLASIGTAVAEAGLPDPTSDVLAAPYLDVCPPSLLGREVRPYSSPHPVRPSPGESDLGDSPSIDLSALPHPDTVYVTLGTVMNQSPLVFRAVIDGCARWPVNVVATTGPGFDPAEFGPASPAVRTAPFLPQAAVLPHCRVVISHAGAGTMFGALCHGLPQLCLPQGTDQPFNTAALVPTGAALALQPDEITAPAVAEAVGRLLEEPGFGRAARSLREEIDHMPSAEQALSTILDVLLPGSAP